jgi:hypothetical protein
MGKMLVYLDNCCFNRPYDDQEHLSIFLETQAKLAIQNAIRNGNIEMAWSFILDYENGQNPENMVRQEISEWKILASKMVNYKENVLDAASGLIDSGFGKKDALHIASAIELKVDYFLTVDKGILRKRTMVQGLSLLSPIEFLAILEDTNAG